MDHKAAIKEAAASQKRHWVRLTRVCNNRCLFCLDKEHHDGACLPVESIGEDLARGRAEGRTRVILSGGEPTVHPRFLDVVAEARRLGYERIQVVTNGRMTAYKDFLSRAADAGLHETTFSIHGHTPELHDRLTQARGSFAQALRGLVGALHYGRFIVNVDIVLNRLNVPELPEILDFFIGLGVKEFDLLQIIPFGLAWENREILFYEPEKWMEPLHRALDRGRRPDVFVWTNRLRAEVLEGYEDFIQNPVKLHDEVRGREEMFRVWRDGGGEPPCRRDRCRVCFMEPFCNAFDRARAGIDGPALRQTPPCLAGTDPLSPPVGAGKNGGGDGYRNPEGRIDPVAFTDHFIRHEYRVKSLRCRACDFDENCPGAPIERIRADGFKILQPRHG